MVLRVRAADRPLVVEHRQRVVKQAPLKGLQGAPLPLGEYVSLMRQQARSRQYGGARPSCGDGQVA